jgi:hypothetical protein
MRRSSRPATTSGWITIYDVPSGEPRAAFKVGSSISAIRWQSLDRLSIATKETRWRYRPWRPRIDRGHAATITALARLDDKLLSSSRDGTLRVWDLAGKQLRTLWLPSCSMFAHSARSLVGLCGKRLLWLTSSGGVARVRAISRPLRALCGTRSGLIGLDKKGQLWRLDPTPSRLSTPKITAMACDTQRQRAVFARATGEIAFFPAGKKAGRIRRAPGVVRSLAVSVAGRLASLDRTGQVVVWLADGRRSFGYRVPKTARGLLWLSGSLVAWDGERSYWKSTPAGPLRVRRNEFSSTVAITDESRLYLGSRAGAIVGVDATGRAAFPAGYRRRDVPSELTTPTTPTTTRGIARRWARGSATTAELRLPHSVWAWGYEDGRVVLVAANTRPRLLYRAKLHGSVTSLAKQTQSQLLVGTRLGDRLMIDLRWLEKSWLELVFELKRTPYRFEGGRLVWRAAKPSRKQVSDR